MHGYKVLYVHIIIIGQNPPIPKFTATFCLIFTDMKNEEKKCCMHFMCVFVCAVCTVLSTACGFFFHFSTKNNNDNYIQRSTAALQCVILPHPHGADDLQDSSKS